MRSLTNRTSSGSRFGGLGRVRREVDALDHLAGPGAAVIHATRKPRNPVNGCWNLRGRTGNRRSQRHERSVRVLCPALHAHVACLRCMCRWADRLTCSLVDMSERRAGQHTSGQTRCRSHGEEPLPHRSSPSRRTTLHSFLYRIGCVPTSQRASYECLRNAPASVRERAVWQGRSSASWADLGLPHPSIRA